MQKGFNKDARQKLLEEFGYDVCMFVGSYRLNVNVNYKTLVACRKWLKEHMRMPQTYDENSDGVVVGRWFYEMTHGGMKQLKKMLEDEFKINIDSLKGVK